ncbi:Uncharacterised protein [Vibrio cholerae]|nr:Uncharacterised protein [Vibrio cholerae]
MFAPWYALFPPTAARLCYRWGSLPQKPKSALNICDWLKEENGAEFHEWPVDPATLALSAYLHCSAPH